MTRKGRGGKNGKVRVRYTCREGGEMVKLRHCEESGEGFYVTDELPFTGYMHVDWSPRHCHTAISLGADRLTYHVQVWKWPDRSCANIECSGRSSEDPEVIRNFSKALAFAADIAEKWNEDTGKPFSSLKLPEVPQRATT